MPDNPSNKYCQMCYISIINMQNGNSDSDDDLMAFSPASNTTGSGFQKIAVKRDTETGEITGWQQFYAMARLENPELEAEEQKHTAMFD